MRLIDGDELQKIFNETSTSLMREPKLLKDMEHMVRAFLMTTEMIKDAPTIEAEPVKHGRWIIHREEIFEPNRSECYMNRPLPTECSVCGFAEMRASRFAFCPNCGARMDGDTND